jgi:hypothetical protein
MARPNRAEQRLAARDSGQHDVHAPGRTAMSGSASYHEPDHRQRRLGPQPASYGRTPTPNLAKRSALPCSLAAPVTAPVSPSVSTSAAEAFERHRLPVRLQKLRDRIQAAPTPQLAGTSLVRSGWSASPGETKAGHCRAGRAFGRTSMTRVAGPVLGRQSRFSIFGQADEALTQAPGQNRRRPLIRGRISCDGLVCRPV